MIVNKRKITLFEIKDQLGHFSVCFVVAVVD